MIENTGRIVESRPENRGTGSKHRAFGLSLSQITKWRVSLIKNVHASAEGDITDVLRKCLFMHALQTILFYYCPTVYVKPRKEAAMPSVNRCSPGQRR